MRWVSSLAMLCVAGILLSGVAFGSAQAAEAMKGEAILIWGADEAQSPNPDYKPVEATIARKLSKSPYRWKYYYEVSRKPLLITEGATMKDVRLSKDCALDVAYPTADHIELKLYGKGKWVSTHKEALPAKQTLVISGPSENETAWLIVIRRNAEEKAVVAPAVVATNPAPAAK